MSSTLPNQSQSASPMLIAKEEWIEEGRQSGVSRNSDQGLGLQSLKDADVEHDDDSHVYSNVESNSGTQTQTNANGGNSESSSSKFTLAASETLMILYSKAILLVFIAIVAALISFATYTLVKKQERDEYHLKVRFRC